MKVCKLCGSTYGDKVDFCFRDGQPLVVSDAPAAGEDVATSPKRPGLADMLDVPEPGFARAVDPTALPDPTSLPDATGLPDPGALADLPERPAPLSPADDPDQSVQPLPPPVDDEDLAPPAPLAPPEPTAPVPMAQVEFADPRGSTLIPGVGGVVGGMTMVPDDELPPPRELGDDRDDQALADLARTLGGDAGTPSDAGADFDEPDAAAASFDGQDDDAVAASPALGDLVAEDDAQGGGANTYIGVDGASSDPYVEDAPAEGSNNKTLYMLFGAALIVLLLGGGYIIATNGAKPDDPMAGLPEEKAAPVVAAPAPPPPEPDPIVEEPVDDLAEDGGTELADGQPLEPTDASGPDAAAMTPEPTRAEPTPPPTATAATPAVTATRPAATTTPPTTVATTPVPPTEDATADIAGGDDPWNTGTTAASGRLTINTIPAGAIVYVDDRQLGRSPLSAELGFGMHTIRVELGGYSSEQRTIDVQVPEMAVPFELKPLVVTGTVNIFGPTGATVLVDGAQVGKIPTSVKLTEGAHAFEVRTTDGSSFTRSQDVRFDGGTTVSVTLAP